MLNLIKLLIVSTIIAGVAWFMYKSGYNACDAEYKTAAVNAVADDQKKIKTIIEYRDKIKVVYRDKIKQIEETTDPTGCADIKLTDMGFRLSE